MNNNRCVLCRFWNGGVRQIFSFNKLSSTGNKKHRMFCRFIIVRRPRFFSLLSLPSYRNVLSKHIKGVFRVQEMLLINIFFDVRRGGFINANTSPVICCRHNMLGSFCNKKKTVIHVLALFTHSLQQNHI